MAAEAGTTKAVAPRYKLEELTRVCELGKGILSKVFLYKHADTGELIAVKEVEKAKVLSKGLLPRVMAERDTLRKLAGLQVPCPHVPAFHGNTQDKSTLYFFSEPALAGPLHLHIAESDGGLPEASARFYAQEVALALAALHEMGVGHRDLKASNVVLRTSGHACLCDFDTAWDFTKGEDTTACVGTPHCMAPEVAACSFNSESANPYGISVDAWSYGVLVCEMLCGKPPLPESIDWRRDGDGVLAFLAAKVSKKEDVDCDQNNIESEKPWPSDDVARLIGGRFPKAAETVLALLQIEPERRPSFGEFKTVETLPWFSDSSMDWVGIHRKEPPSFSKKFVCEFAEGGGAEKPLSAEQQALFDF